MPANEQYQFTAMSLQKRGDGCCLDRYIRGVRFLYMDGKALKWHNGAKYTATGQKPNTPKDTELKFDIKPPITSNKVRVYIDKSHANSGWYQGRFDLWAVKV